MKTVVVSRPYQGILINAILRYPEEMEREPESRSLDYTVRAPARAGRPRPPAPAPPRRTVAPAPHALVFIVSNIHVDVSIEHLNSHPTKVCTKLALQSVTSH